MRVHKAVLKRQRRKPPPPEKARTFLSHEEFPPRNFSIIDLLLSLCRACGKISITAGKNKSTNIGTANLSRIPVQALMNDAVLALTSDIQLVCNSSCDSESRSCGAQAAFRIVRNLSVTLLGVHFDELLCLGAGEHARER